MESDCFANLAVLDCGKNSGVSRVVVVAQLDGKTSAVCRDKHGLIVEISKAKAGENIPPFHPEPERDRAARSAGFAKRNF